MLPPPVADRVDEYLGRVDAALPGRVEALYLVGSIALGAFRPRRSDIDFVAVVGRDGLEHDEVVRLRSVQRRLYDREAARSLSRGRWPFVPNGCYVRSGDLERPPAEVTPVASHNSRQFEVGTGFDVNPVTWRILRTHGIAVRGPEVSTLDIPDDDGELRRWNRANLEGYWRAWAEAVRRPGPKACRASFRHTGSAWGALGAPRLHHTIATGEIITKEQAGEYALDVFDRCWHGVIRDGLAYWRGEGRPFGLAPRQARATADFVTMVVESVPHASPEAGGC